MTNDDTMADYWRDVRPAMQAESKARRERNRNASAHLLEQAGIAFKAHSYGVHLVVTDHSHTYDFWPGTGLWKLRGSTLQRRGVRSLIQQINRNKSNV